MTARQQVPKVLGCDAELANFVEGDWGESGTAPIAAQLLFRELDGVRSGGGDTGGSGEEFGRKFSAATGGGGYIDHHHLELTQPETLSAYDFVAAWQASLLFARDAMQAANRRLSGGLRVRVLANNSDGLGNAYGNHLSVLVSRRAFNDIFHRKLHYLLYLATYQVSSIVFTGQGKVGAENGAPAVDYQLHQRADFFESLVGPQTTHHRPIVNTRDEALCGASTGTPVAQQLARLHVIFYDSNLCHVACLLKAGVLQIVAAMLEAGFVNPSLLLDDPLTAVVRWSHDVQLRETARLAGGGRTTAVDLQLRFLDEARRFHECGGCETPVPHARAILQLWADVLAQLKGGNLEPLAGSIDWILKLQLLRRARALEPTLSPAQLKHLDHLYASLDPEAGLYWACARSGKVRELVTPSQVEQMRLEPPSDTRAWGRAQLLRLAGPSRVRQVDWDRIRFVLEGSGGRRILETVEMPDPVSMTKPEVGCLFTENSTFESVLERLRNRAAD